jgi:hypothetical protein
MPRSDALNFEEEAYPNAHYVQTERPTLRKLRSRPAIEQMDQAVLESAMSAIVESYIESWYA